MLDANNYKQHPLYPIYLNYAQRALLGGGKGAFVMEQLQNDNPECYKLVMEDAKKLVMNIPIKDYQKEITKLLAKNLTNMANVVNHSNIIETYEGEMKSEG
jgi:hypothetical protein